MGYPLLLSELFDVGCNFNFGNEMAGCVACVAGSAISIYRGHGECTALCAVHRKALAPFLLAQLAKRASQQHQPCMGRAVPRAVRLGEWLITARFRISMCGKTKPSIIEQASTGRVHMSPFKSPSAPHLHFCVHYSHELVRRRGGISSCPTESKRCFSHYKPLSPVGLLNQA